LEKVLLTAKSLDGAILDLCGEVVWLQAPSRELRKHILEPLIQVGDEEAILSQTEYSSCGDCARLVRLARIASLSEKGNQKKKKREGKESAIKCIFPSGPRDVTSAHVEAALAAFGPFGDGMLKI
jgi:hypothetical protein